MAELLQTVGFIIVPELQLDSSAARGVLWRTGVGRIRHLEVKTLWVQDLVAAGRLQVKAVPGTENVADIGTKVLTAERIEFLKKKVGIITIEMVDDIENNGGRTTVKIAGASSSTTAQRVLAVLTA